MGTQGQGDGGGAAAGPDAKKDDIYENRPGHKKIIRVVTVMAYMVSVSFVAIVLSAYYVFLWHPPNPRLMHRSHLRGDPQVDYLVHKPPVEVSLDESFSGIDIRDELAFKEEILRNRGVNVPIESRPEDISPEKPTNFDVSPVTMLSTKNETFGNDSRVSASTWNPIVRALLATTQIPTNEEETRGNATGVYDSVNVPTRSSLDTANLEASTLFMATWNINGSTIRLSSSSPSSSTSTPLTEDRDKLNNVSVNYFTLNDTTFTQMNIKSSEVNRSLNNSAKNFFATTLEQNIEDSTEPTKVYKFLEKSTTTEAQKPPEEETTVFRSPGSSRPTKIQPETVQTTPASAKQRGSESKALEFIVQPRELGSHIEKLPTKSLTNETELLQKITSSLQTNEEDPAEVAVSGFTEDAETVSKSEVSAMLPAVVQPESEFVEKSQESKEQPSQDGDFGFV